MLRRLGRQITRLTRTAPLAEPVTPFETSSSLTPGAVFHDAAMKFLDVQVSSNDVLDSKIASAVSVGSAVLPLTFGLSRIGPGSVGGWSERWFYAAIGAYGILLLCGVVASFIRTIEYRPDIPTLKNHSAGYTGEELRFWVATEYMASIDTNKSRLSRKVWVAGLASLALYAEGLLLSLAAVTILR